MSSASQPDPRSFPELITELLSDTKTLIKKELELLKAELAAKADDFKVAVVAAIGGLALMFSGVLILLLGAVYGLAMSMPMWAAALIVGSIAAVGGVLLLKAGVPDGKTETEKSVRESAQAIKDQLS